MKGTGSFVSFRGIKATGTSGLDADFAAAAVEGGVTGRVADCGNVLVDLLVGAAFGGTRAALLVSLFVAGGLALGTIDPTKILEATTGSFVPSFSFKRFVSDCCSGVILWLADGE